MPLRFWPIQPASALRASAVRRSLAEGGKDRPDERTWVRPIHTASARLASFGESRRSRRRRRKDRPDALAVVLIALFCSGCATVAPPGGTATTPTPASALGDMLADARTLQQSSNAGRLDAVQKLLGARGLTFTSQAFPNSQRARDPREEGHNLVVDLPGGSGRDIIVGAHLDAVPLGDGQHSRGMVDNGAGVIVLSRVAETLRRQRLRHRIRIVFFDMEENNLTGSKAFVAGLDRSRVAAMVNIDIAGYGDTVMAGPATAVGSEPLHLALARVCAAGGYSCVRFPAFPNSDDRSFSAAGIPSISLAVLPALEAHQVWLLLNGGKESGLAGGFAPAILRTIHTREDTADKLNPAGMTLLYNAVLGLVLDLDATGTV